MLTGKISRRTNIGIVGTGECSEPNAASNESAGLKLSVF